MLDDPLQLARLQFALTAATHYMFVAFTLGLAPYVLFSQLSATLRRDEARMRAVRFWGGLYVVNYAMGILSGLVMELQLALNWQGLGEVFGYAFGAPLAVETMAAFFVESTFLGLWIFGWDRMGRWAHWGCFLVVTATAYASAYWVLVANGFLKWPAGFAIEDGVAVIDDAWVLVANPSALMGFAHVVMSTMLVGGAVIIATSAYHLRRRNDPDRMYHRSIRHGVVLLMIGLIPTVISGGVQFTLLGKEPPTSGATYSAAEIAAIEQGHGDGSSAQVFGGLGLALMMLAWSLLACVCILTALVWLVGRLDRWRWHLRLLAFVPVLPYAASVGGWVFRETERQPWVVRHHLTTADAMTDMSPLMAGVSFTFFTVAFALLGTVTAWLLIRLARRGPDASPLAAPDLSAPDDLDRGPAPTL
ncbi:cytochrome ubiquinol oxidase subunit I [Nocardiopsis gilva YIM 90087]|uniref:Cytochrome ubiquinol oxidase subunit I n=1 Tax=Nocardiopsis gilva YIM 90087 TaxID=1235441 RepID=A0A223SCZ4_9ACTN|nr:cytochrome ubiquinol oxidase subunit I [Nocardiopsis gilva]ASU85956.1 cytochrome ubiquinol oxidase subunit I [Nocardiopsis gilva YIM 90087]